MANKKNKMTISCSVDVEAKFKAICDFINKNSKKKTINGNHSKEIVKFMTKFYNCEFKKLSGIDKANVSNEVAIYTENKNNNNIY